MRFKLLLCLMVFIKASTLSFAYEKKLAICAVFKDDARFLIQDIYLGDIYGQIQNQQYAIGKDGVGERIIFAYICLGMEINLADVFEINT